MAKWYKEKYRRCLVDMHIPEYDPAFLSKFDAKVYAKNMKKAHVEIAYIYTSNCLGTCYWPTKTGHFHENIKAQGRDLVQELIDALNAENIQPILYTNFWAKHWCDLHPDWQVKLPDGGMSYAFYDGKHGSRFFGRYGVCCMNSPFQQLMESEIEELLSKYPTEAIWIDMAGSFMLCTCEHCRARFKKETGYDIPDKMDWNDPVWIKFVKTRFEWNLESLNNLRGAAKRVKPDIDIIFNSARYVQNWLRCLNTEYYATSDFVAGDYNSGRPYNSFFSKYFCAMSPEKPGEFLCPVMADLAAHNQTLTETQLTVLMFTSITNGAAFGFIDAIDPIGTMNDMVYERMDKVYTEMEKFQPYIDSDVVLESDIALYASNECSVDERDNGLKPYSKKQDLEHFETTREFATLLKKMGLPYKVVTRNNLDELKDCKLLLLSEVNSFYEDEIKAIDEFVKNGGSVYASGDIGKYRSEDYSRAGAGIFKDMFGVEIVGDKDPEVNTYMRPTENGTQLFGIYTEEHPLSLCAGRRNTMVNVVSGAEVLGKLTYPYQPENPMLFSSAISNPPWEKTEKVALVKNKYGKGTAIYSSYPIEMLKTVDQNAMFKRLLLSLLPEDKKCILDAPSCVEVTIHKQLNKGATVVNILNDQIAEVNLPVYDVKVKVKLDFIPKSVTSVDGGINYEYNDGYLTIVVPKLEIYKMIVII